MESNKIFGVRFREAINPSQMFQTVSPIRRALFGRLFLSFTAIPGHRSTKPDFATQISARPQKSVIP